MFSYIFSYYFFLTYLMYVGDFLPLFLYIAELVMSIKCFVVVKLHLIIHFFYKGQKYIQGGGIKLTMKRLRNINLNIEICLLGYKLKLYSKQKPSAANKASRQLLNQKYAFLTCAGSNRQNCSYKKQFLGVGSYQFLVILSTYNQIKHCNVENNGKNNVQ